MCVSWLILKFLLNKSGAIVGHKHKARCTYPSTWCMSTGALCWMFYPWGSPFHFMVCTQMVPKVFNYFDQHNMVPNLCDILESLGKFKYVYISHDWFTKKKVIGLGRNLVIVILNIFLEFENKIIGKHWLHLLVKVFPQIDSYVCVVLFTRLCPVEWM